MSKPDKVIPHKVRGFKLGEGTYTFDKYDAILYALGLGFSKDPMNRDHFKWTYENEYGFSIFPTMNVLAIKNGFEELFNCPGLPEFNPMMLLHGEQKIQNYQPIEPGQTVKTQAYIADIADKVKGALVTVVVSLNHDETGERLQDIIGRLFIRGIGGFGDKGVDEDHIPAIPEKEPEHVAEEPTEPSRALLYRLSGDINPLHIDPNMAALGGFEKPILHGLCSYGISAKAVWEKYGRGDPNSVVAMNARFTSHVFPGETLVVHCYPESEDSVIFQTTTKERGKPVVVGRVEFVKQAAL